MELDVEKARQAGYEVLAIGGTLATFEVSVALREAAAGLAGLGVAGGLGVAADVFEAYVGRMHDEHEWLGHTVVDAAGVVGATDDGAGAAIRRIGLPG